MRTCAFGSADYIMSLLRTALRACFNAIPVAFLWWQKLCGSQGTRMICKLNPRLRSAPVAARTVPVCNASRGLHNGAR
jgi:uncharacterized protein involved in tolerance to divalent cations